MGTLHAVDANIQMIEGNYRTAEKLAREALDERRRFLLKGSDRSPAAHNCAPGPNTRFRPHDCSHSRLRQTAGSGKPRLYARAALTDTMALSGSNTAEAAQGLAVIGMIRLRQGRIEQANALFERAVQALLGAEGSALFAQARRLSRARVGMTLAMQSRWSEAGECLRAAPCRLAPEPGTVRDSRFGGS